MIKSSIVVRSLFPKVCFLILMFVPTMTFADTYNIIPYPQKLVAQQGKFVFNQQTVIVCSKQNTEVYKIALQFANQLELVSGIKLVVKESADTDHAVFFQLGNDLKSGSESYSLTVSATSIRISATSANGVFYALQTLYQLLPADIYGKQHSSLTEWSVPAVQITDAPRFSYRGLHLDVCRHFYPVEFIKKYIDAMAIHKFNTFHWHLTDDQGWRIEIKKYPLVTKVGARRVETLVGLYTENYPQRFDDDAYGGFYTQAEAKEIVEYAKERFITVIPEIEMPGHATAAVASYPYLSCNRMPVKVATKWGVFKDVYCPRDTTFAFLEDVLTEIMAIFPSQYIHIGGDECPKDHWKVCPDCQARIKTENLKDENGLQSYFIHRIEKFLNAHNRRIVGWDEILDGGLAPNATVMSWRGTEGGIAAAKAGHQVIMTPVANCYFDYYQADPATEPIAIGGYLPLKKVYMYEPVPSALTKQESAFILGAQANVWSEYLKNSDKVEYMAFPRVSAMSEVLWTDSVNKSWSRFRTSMPKEFDRYAALSIKAANVFYDVQCRVTATNHRTLLVQLESDNPNAEIHYTINGSTPGKNDKVYTEPIELSASATVKAIAYEKAEVVSKEFSKSYVVSKVTGLSYTQNPINTWYKGDNQYSLTDGIQGNTRIYAQWVGIGAGKDGEIIIDLQKSEQINRLSVGLLSAPGLGAMYPLAIKVATSLDGNVYSQVATESINPRTTGTWEIYRPELIFPIASVRFIKLTLQSAGISPNADAAGGASLMFLDEIGVW